MALTPSFRHRILGVLILVGAIPTALAVLGWALTLRSAAPAGRATIEEVATSGRALLASIDTTRLAPGARRMVAEHAQRLNEALVKSQRADAYGQYYSAGLGLVVLVLGMVLIYVSVRLGGHLSRQLSRPIDELIGWTRNIRRHEPLPADRPRRGAPEFASLRTAIRDMATELDQARDRELEAERLRAFREVARRVAHEMKNPLTPIRFAIASLARSSDPGQREAIDVLTTETARLEGLAREFADLGRLPEGPPAEVDLGELAGDVVRTSLPETVTATVTVDPTAPRIVGHYEPLRRALGNLVRNASEAMNGSGRLDVRVRRTEPAGVAVDIADHGPGIAREIRPRLFQPYATTKADGTGLGLALVRQAAELHGGSVTATDTPGGGATFTLSLPAGSAASGSRPGGAAGLVERSPIRTPIPQARA